MKAVAMLFQSRLFRVVDFVVVVVLVSGSLAEFFRCVRVVVLIVYDESSLGTNLTLASCDDRRRVYVAGSPLGNQLALVYERARSSRSRLGQTFGRQFANATAGLGPPAQV